MNPRKYANSFGLVVAMAAGCLTLQAQSGAGAAFDKIKALEGEWSGKTSGGMAVTTKFRTTAGGSAVLQMLGEGTEMEMPTVYHLDGDRLILTHYCAAKNQPRMVLKPETQTGSAMSFQFLDATNLSSPEAGRMNAVTIEFVDRDHLRQHWTFRDKGKDSVDVFEFARKR